MLVSPIPFSNRGPGQTCQFNEGGEFYFIFLKENMFYFILISIKIYSIKHETSANIIDTVTLVLCLYNKSSLSNS